MSFDVLYWHWLIFGMLLMMLEIFLPSFTALWFGIGGILVGLLLLIVPGMALGIQILLWAVFSAILTFIWFRFLGPINPDRKESRLSREAVVGETGQVIQAPMDEKRGVVRFATPKLGSEEWSFICEEPVTVGDRVRVTDVMGNALIVTKNA